MYFVSITGATGLHGTNTAVGDGSLQSIGVRAAEALAGLLKQTCIAAKLLSGSPPIDSMAEHKTCTRVWYKAVMAATVVFGLLAAAQRLIVVVAFL